MTEALESITINPTNDFCFVGSTSGNIYTISLSIAALNITTNNNINGVTTTNNNGSNNIQNQKSLLSSNSSNIRNSNKTSSNVPSTTSTTTNINTNTSDNNNNIIIRTLKGHSRIITSLSVSLDNTTLISTSEDGSVRVWDIWNGQCIKELKPLNKCAVSNAMVGYKR